jgi:phosphoribosylaminoimidazole-succinocarboxamide synthase
MKKSDETEIKARKILNILIYGEIKHIKHIVSRIYHEIVIYPKNAGIVVMDMFGDIGGISMDIG